MPVAKLKKPGPHRSQAEEPVGSTSFLKSIGMVNARLGSLASGLPAKLVGARLGAQMGAASKLVADHRRGQAEKAATSSKKLSDIMDSAHACLKNKKIGGHA